MYIACDTHVHCYQFDQIAELLDQAMSNFSRLTPKATHRVLFFTDGNIDKTWINLHALIKQGGVSADWQFVFNTHSGFVEAKKDGNVIYLAPARQINSAERLEFLLLGCDEDVQDGTPATEIIEKNASDYAVISPWGVGKWLGKRGKIMSDLIAKQTGWFLGDNGGRPAVWIGIKQCQQARQQGMAIFNGSDPLPIDGELQRVAAYGIYCETTLGEFCLKDLLNSLRKQPSQWKNFGQALGIIPFIKGRVAMARRA